ncbi:hypothetical protein FIV02_12290 [Pseudomonas sp. THAF187a]|uniref:hypothetical protein n=1 Tax=unclassified Pseudomonas TaxID=196821 RepID=UPI001268295B|nr:MULTISPECIES: hypothetical protein [unclassified Pseudomonas]QFT22352.1 hypothetical protein FIV02_12290 [Pseudomonas sp. THAF187a]QFT42539.1 hypothetical protein FIU98_12270 [Pseudomonas sp. THAF42]
MKANKEDIPDYIRSKKKPGPWRMVAILGVGSAITWGVIALFAKPIVINVDQLKQAIHVDGKPLFSQQPAPQPYSEPEEPIRLPSIPVDPPVQDVQPYKQTQADIEWAEKSKAMAIERIRNSFNDNNYTPKQPANTYTPPAIQQVAATQRTEKRQTKQTIRDQTARWIRSWNGGSKYLAEWVAINNYIDGSSVCANHRRGSIDYRECRKAAKQHFHEECKTWRAKYDSDRKAYSDRMKTRYCSAASSFNPMG